MSRPGRYSPGVIVAAIGWAALQALFQIYVAISSSSESAGPIGAILLLLTWLYFGGLILLVGGVVNATHGLGTSRSNPTRRPPETGRSRRFPKMRTAIPSSIRTGTNATVSRLN